MKFRIAFLFSSWCWIFLLSGCIDNCGCSSLRNYHIGVDKKINELKDKITVLERDRIKDVKTSNQLGSAYNQLGLIYLEKKMWNPAIESFQNCIKYGYNGASIQYALGLAYANRGKTTASDGDYEKAEKQYRLALEMQNDLHDAKYALAILQFYHLDKKEEAVALLESLVSENPKYYKGRFALGRFTYENGKLEKALRVYEDLYDDVENLPDSQVSIEYRNSAKENINTIMMELSRGKGSE